MGVSQSGNAIRFIDSQLHRVALNRPQYANDPKVLRAVYSFASRFAYVHARTIRPIEKSLLAVNRDTKRDEIFQCSIRVAYRRPVLFNPLHSTAPPEETSYYFDNYNECINLMQCVYNSIMSVYKYNDVRRTKVLQKKKFLKTVWSQVDTSEELGFLQFFTKV